MLNRAERRAIAQGKGFSILRWCYQPSHSFTGIDSEINFAMLEEDSNSYMGCCMPPNRFADLWADQVPDHPSQYAEEQS